MAVGVVRRPFGLRGEVFVHPDPDLAEDFPVGRRYWAVGAASPDAPPTLTVRSSVVHRGLRVVRFGGITDRDAAAGLLDAVLWRDAVPGDLEQDAFWSGDLLGRPVVDPDGTPLGVLSEVRDGTAHDYLVVTDQRGREVLIPAVAELVTVEPDRIVLAPLPGLLDPGEAEEG